MNNIRKVFLLNNSDELFENFIQDEFEEVKEEHKEIYKFICNNKGKELFLIEELKEEINEEIIEFYKVKKYLKTASFKIPDFCFQLINENEPNENNNTQPIRKTPILDRIKHNQNLFSIVIICILAIMIVSNKLNYSNANVLTTYNNYEELINLDENNILNLSYDDSLTIMNTINKIKIDELKIQQSNRKIINNSISKVKKIDSLYDNINSHILNISNP